MQTTFDDVLRASPEYFKVFLSHPVNDIDPYNDEFYESVMKKFKEGKSQLDLEIIYTEQLRRQ